MAFISGTDRYQMSFGDMFSFDNLIAEDNYVRVIDAFVDTLDLKKLGFIMFSGNNKGQKPYRTSDLLKIHIYCFFNGIQSSRKQERECARNIEIIWLTGNLKPDYSTIANFCKYNSVPLKKVFKEFTTICKKLELFDFKIFAIDGTKIKASCSKKRAFTMDRLNEAILNIDVKIKEYIAAIDDENTDKDALASFKEKLKIIEDRKVEYEGYKKQMEDENLTELCITDPDAKIMKNHQNIEPCYNVQSVVDSKNKLILDYDVSRQANDVGLLKPMTDKVFEDNNLDKFLEENPDKTITVLADAGYYKASDMLDINTDNVKALVPKPKASNSTNDMSFSKDNFEYNSEKDIYICPMKKELRFVRKSTEKRNGVVNNYKIYSCFSCLGCKYIDKCTKSIDGRTIKRNIKEDSLMKFDFEYKKDSKFYKLRKELVEHPFGTIKYALGLNHLYIRGMKGVSAWAASVFLAYDLKRVINILGTKQIIAKLEALKSN